MAEPLGGETVRRPLLVRTVLEVLRDTGRPLPPGQAVAAVASRVDLTPAELSVNDSGIPRWETFVRWVSSWAKTVGWMSKHGGWSLTEAGAEAVDTYSDGLYKELTRRYRLRYKAKKTGDQLRDKLVTFLTLVEEGSWTSVSDLAGALDLPDSELRDILRWAELPNAHRVLTRDGRVLADESQDIDRLRAELVGEGVESDAEGRASQAQRLSAENLLELSQHADDESGVRRAWLVRGSNVDGRDLVPEWLAEGWVSLAASQLPAVDPGIGEPRLREIVADAYRHKNYSVREKLTDEFDAFLRQIRDDDYVLTMHRGDVYLGLVTGPPTFHESADRRSNLRRPVRWLNADRALDLTELPAPLPTLVQSQDDVIDLTAGLDALERLYAPYVMEQPPKPPLPEARLADVTDELASELLIADRGWLDELVELLAERRQIIMYGPPGTGKTYLARKLAYHLAEPHSVQLVQFHPSYTYEDFFEGFRPKSTSDGRLEFELRPGAFRKLAEEAREHPSTVYILIIDEINRGNLAKIFGELYFLLEYRDHRVRLQYSQEDFTLPANFYMIGTMNTADRSIALVDAAMRRRFAFVEMHPSKPPVVGLLSRWLAREGIESDAPALLDALNDRLRDADYAIGPSYLMRRSAYDKPDGLDRVWRHDILPLLVEQHYADDIDVEATYGLPALRAGLGLP
jgi:5-methylcytosine-specific restriction protein B